MAYRELENGHCSKSVADVIAAEMDELMSEC